MLELIIASTCYDSFRKDLLGKPIGYATADKLQEGRTYEATTAGNAQLQRMSQVSEEVAERTHERKCSNCVTNHKPRQCPAYRDACNACGAIGHWEKCCRKNGCKVNRHINRAIAALEDVLTAPRDTNMGNTPKETVQGGKTKMSTHLRTVRTTIGTLPNWWREHTKKDCYSTLQSAPSSK